jgi:hypothetical protein
MWIRRGKTTGTVVCIASDDANLHDSYGDVLRLVESYEDLELSPEHGLGRVGDVFKNNTWTEHPENYPQPSEAQVNEAKVTAKVNELARSRAIQILIAEGELLPDYREA